MKSEDFFSEEETFKHFDKINHSVEKLNRFISHTILWIKAQLKGFKVAEDVVSVKREIEDVVAFCQEQLDEKNITVHNQTNDQTELVCDRNMFAIVLRNLLMNGIKFSHRDTSISVEESQEDDGYILYIKDSGIGIPEEKIENLFSLETKSSLGTNKEFGTGIGLPLSYSLMKKMGGTLKCYSDKGKGTTFTMVFPS